MTNPESLLKSLKEYEILCPKCNGYGVLCDQSHECIGCEHLCITCDKCWGEGKLDWVENIVGKTPSFRVTWDESENFKSAFDTKAFDEITTALSEELAMEIDRQIIEELEKEEKKWEK